MLELTHPPGLGDGQPFRVHEVGESVPVAMKTKAGVALSESVEVYAGARRLGRLSAHTLSATFKQPGIYPIYLKSKDADGRTMLSRPHTMLVAPRAK